MDLIRKQDTRSLKENTVVVFSLFDTRPSILHGLYTGANAQAPDNAADLVSKESCNKNAWTASRGMQASTLKAYCRLLQVAAIKPTPPHAPKVSENKHERC